MRSLFNGYDQAYGTHGKPTQRVGALKQEIKKTALTVRGEVTDELWEKHLKGEDPIGIIPIRRDGTCRFGAIDVDDYDLNHVDIVKKLESLGFPFPVTRSKSGGAHIWAFFRESIPAEDVIAGLRDISAKIGHGGSEIFPKQSQVFWERGDFGSWINMPYFGDTRLAVKPNGLSFTLREFLSIAERSALSISEFATLIKKKVKKGDPSPTSLTDLSDGPPCLDHLLSAGFPDGTRNKGLFALGIYAKKKYGDKWKDKLDEFNQAGMQPPLASDEVAGIVKSLNKKEYNYTCNESPLCQHCNASLCRTKKFGVGNSEDFPAISGLSVLTCVPPVWYVNVGDDRLELTTEEFLDYRKFHRICMERLRRSFKLMKQGTWIDMINTAMESCTDIEAPPDLGEQGEFMEHVQEFLVNRHTGTRVEDLLLGRPYNREDEGRHYFRMKDLQAYLTRENFPMDRTKIASYIRKTGGDRDFINIKGVGTNVWWVKSSLLQKTPDPEPHGFRVIHGGGQI